ncbi:PAS domain S-box-containing protein [Nannocystis exedens]|uniref:histidine kinase n=1 Tax=Nannocystis exedens TaxID=54 RepID=A0A1I2J062_9BACT|nr:PAS domain-containing sensor histidine kinase [Nannocystis exedens]PCC69388.1 hybrid sensor histidine kinase/response regulator [Nannocystis exedens]SFF46336.1 PAS domain S-box-containing protein [Nannocystis exedens]
MSRTADDDTRTAERRFAALAQATGQTVWRLAADGARPLEDSPSFRALTGVSREQWQGHGVLAGIHPDDRERVEAAVRAAVAAGAGWEVEARLPRPDGQHAWTLLRATPVTDARGERLEWVGVAADIHKRKDVEAFREMMLGILGHDLRNPLNAMMVSAQLALLRAREEPVRTPLERVLASGERMGRLIEQLLDLTQVRLGHGIAVNPVAADLREIVEQAIEELPNGKARVRFDAVGDLRGTWDFDRLLQVVTILLGNAVDHGTPGAAITVRAVGDAPDAVELTVHNHGPAVPESVRDSVFEPLRRIDPTRRHGARALGLGLFVTRQLVLAHGGTIAFESSDAGGNLMHVHLPRRVPA